MRACAGEQRVNALCLLAGENLRWPVGVVEYRLSYALRLGGREADLATRRWSRLAARTRSGE